MKKIIFVCLLALPFFMFTACEKEDEKGATVSITVKKSGSTQSNITVYMFDKASTETFGNNPMYAKKTSVSDENGVAVFELQDTFDLSVIDSQTTLYFTVLEKNEGAITSYTVRGSVGVTVKKGDNIKKDLTIN